MAWRRLGDKPLSKQIMVLFNDASFGLNDLIDMVNIDISKYIPKSGFYSSMMSFCVMYMPHEVHLSSG